MSTASRSHILERLWAAISCQIGSIEHLQGSLLITNRKSQQALGQSQGPRKTRSCPDTIVDAYMSTGGGGARTDLEGDLSLFRYDGD